MTLDQRRQSLLSSVGGAVAQSVPSFISTDRSPRDRTAVRWVHLGTATGGRLSQPQKHGEVSGSKLIRRAHGFGPLLLGQLLGQPRSGPRCIEGYSWQCQDAPLCVRLRQQFLPMELDWFHNSDGDQHDPNPFRRATASIISVF